MYEKSQIEKMLKKLKRLEDMLHDRMFIKVGQVDHVKAYTTTEPLHSIPDSSLFEPCEVGKRWEQEGLYGWFQGCFEVSENLAGQSLFIFPRIKGYEGLLWVNGKPYGNFASKIKVNFGGLGNHYCDLLVKDAAAGEKIDIVLEYYSHHEIRGEDAFSVYEEVFDIQYDGVDICVKDELICNFYYDLYIANQMARYLQDDVRKADVIRVLVQINAMVDYDIDLADPVKWRKSVKEADLLLQKLLQDKNGSRTMFFGLTGHSHMDTAWLWHVDETVKKCARTYSNQLALMDQYPEYRFIQSSSLHTAWMEREYPDTFGYSASLPQIMKGCGIKYFVTTKMSWNDTNVFPYNTFYWEGIDKSRVLAYTAMGGARPDPQTLLGAMYGTDLIEKTVNDQAIFMYGSGDGGGGPEFEYIEVVNRLKDVAGLPRTEHVSVSEMLKRKEEGAFRPSVYSGELYLELHRGTLTNQHQIKHNNRVAERSLRNLEYFTVLDALERKTPISAENINPLTEMLLQNQFHDILPGTCIPRAHKEAREQVGWVIEEAQKQIRALAEKKEENKYITAHNTLSFDRNDVIYLPLEEGFIKGTSLHDHLYKK